MVPVHHTSQITENQSLPFTFMLAWLQWGRITSTSVVALSPVRGFWNEVMFSLSSILDMKIPQCPSVCLWDTKTENIQSKLTHSITAPDKRINMMNLKSHKPNCFRLDNWTLWIYYQWTGSFSPFWIWWWSWWTLDLYKIISLKYGEPLNCDWSISSESLVSGPLNLHFIHHILNDY